MGAGSEGSGDTALPALRIHEGCGGFASPTGAVQKVAVQKSTVQEGPIQKGLLQKGQTQKGSVFGYSQIPEVRKSQSRLDAMVDLSHPVHLKFLGKHTVDVLTYAPGPYGMKKYRYVRFKCETCWPDTSPLNPLGVLDKEELRALASRDSGGSVPLQTGPVTRPDQATPGRAEHPRLRFATR